MWNWKCCRAKKYVSLELVEKRVIVLWKLSESNSKRQKRQSFVSLRLKKVHKGTYTCLMYFPVFFFYLTRCRFSVLFFFHLFSIFLFLRSNIFLLSVRVLSNIAVETKAVVSIDIEMETPYGVKVNANAFKWNEFLFFTCLPVKVM